MSTQPILLIYNNLQIPIPLYHISILSLGLLQEYILQKCSLIIYNIEYSELVFNNGFTIKLGDETAEFNKLLSVFLSEHSDLTLEKIILYDRKRDENDNVIKENIYIDRFNNWIMNSSEIPDLIDTREFIGNISNIFSQIFQPRTTQPFTQPFAQPFTQPVYTNVQQTNNNNNIINDEDDDEGIYSNTSGNVIFSEPLHSAEELNNIVGILDQYVANYTNNLQQQEELYNNSSGATINNPLLNNFFRRNLSNNSTQQQPQPNPLLQTLFSTLSGNIGMENMGINIDFNNIENNPEFYNTFLHALNHNMSASTNTTPTSAGNLYDYISYSINSPITSTMSNNNGEMVFSIPIDITISNPNNISMFTQNLFNNFQFDDVVVALTDEEFNKLDKQLYTLKSTQSGEEGEDNCMICCDCYEENNEIIVLQCKHNFHTNCIRKWLCEFNNKCPMCKLEISKGRPLNNTNNLNNSNNTHNSPPTFFQQTFDYDDSESNSESNSDDDESDSENNSENNSESDDDKDDDSD